MKLSNSSKTAAVGKGQVREFVADIKGEIKKVTWTSKDELIAYTKIIVISTFLFGLGIFGVDLLIQRFLLGFSQLLQLLIG